MRHALSLGKAFKKSEDKAEDKKSSYWTLDDTVPVKSKKHKIKHSTAVKQDQVSSPYTLGKQESEPDAKQPKLDEDALAVDQLTRIYTNMASF